MKRECLACGAISSKPRCPRCEAAIRRHYNDPDYQRARLSVIGGPCALRLPGCTGIATTADHLVPLTRGGTLDDGVRGVCGHCNAARGNRDG